LGVEYDQPEHSGVKGPGEFVLRRGRAYGDLVSRDILELGHPGVLPHGALLLVVSRGTMPEVKSGGVRISYETVGEGRPLMLLHGWCCDRSWWTEPGYVDELRSDHRVVNVDLRGHGASDKPHEAGAYKMSAMTGDVFAVADAQGLGTFPDTGPAGG
jgi:hypothetical protein